MENMKQFLRNNTIRIAIGTVSVLIILGAALSYYNKSVMSNALVLKEQSNLVLKEVERTYQTIQLMDISARGFALVRQPEYLFWSVKMSNDRNADIFQNLDSLFALQDFKNPKLYSEVKKGLDDYTRMYAQMVVHLQANEDSLYMDLLKKDVGRYFWEVFNPFSQDVNSFEAKANADAQQSYEEAVMRNTMLQVLLILIGLPTLGWVVYRLEKDEKERKSLLMNVQTNNRQYLFDDGGSDESEAKTILGKSIQDLQKAAAFVNEISKGNYEAQWNGLTETNISKNQDNLAGRLMFMRSEMKKVKEEDHKRMWTTEGLSEFSQIIRQHQDDLKELTMKALTYLIKYCQCQQGSLFVVSYEEEEPYLELSACYAFDRKKHVTKRINSGEGLIGQSYLEGSTTLIKTVPKDYVAITSGLGDATPRCILIVPMKHNDSVHAILELASFQELEPHEIAFLEKAGEFIASAIATVQNNEQNKIVMEQMRMQTEQLRAQEEELRQNLEELEATQEEMRRKETWGSPN